MVSRPDVDDLPTLYPEIIEVAPPPGRGMLGYYRKTDGWIITGPTTPSNRHDFEYKGYTFLAQYGEFKPDTADPRGQPRGLDARGVPWNSALEPWRLIFQRGGGHEFPAEQIIAFRWHIRPPYREVKFPQLANVQIFDLPCPECTPQRVFSALTEAMTTEYLKAHLTSGINRRHDYSPTDLRELGKEWSLNFETSRVGRVRRDTEMGDAPSLEESPIDDLLAPDLTVLEEDEAPVVAAPRRRRRP